MKIMSVEISNFKAIQSVKLDLHPTFNVLVGANGSGKSSVLQAMHWMFQSGRNLKVETNRDDKGATLSEKDAIYMPSPDYRQAGHGGEYGNNHGKPQMDVTVVAKNDDGGTVTAKMWIKAARNEGISVHIPSGNQLVTVLRDRNREFSAYIPGLAGIPLVEEKRAKLLVHRSAAAGDANTVLRNMLDLLRQRPMGEGTALDEVERLVGRVMGDFAIKVNFDENKHTRVLASFSTNGSASRDGAGYRPLELAGIGYLQVLQIFAYLVYFNPVVLLVDEPDAHLYPIAQERLVEVLGQAAREYGSQVVMTTHSPSIVRALPNESRVIWMDKGTIQKDGDTSGRQLMGWGLLDRKVLLLTEDEKTDMLHSLVSQWPDLERATAIWPLHGSSNLPPVEALKALKALLGGDVKIVLHRDRDFLMPVEVEKLAKPYIDAGFGFWVTRHSDIESYWAESKVIAAHFKLSEEEAVQILEKAVEAVKQDDSAEEKRRKKRNDVLQKLNREGKLPQFGDMEVLAEVTKGGAQHAIMGKTLTARIRSVAGSKHSGFGQSVPEGLDFELADDLKAMLAGIR